VADFDGGTITSDGGGLLLREVDRHLGLVDKLNAALPDPRDPSRVTHQQRHMLAQRVFGIALGHEDLNDHHALRTDPLVQAVTGRGIDPDQPLASPTTLCRLENRATDRKALFEMSKALVDVFVASHAEPPGELVLDFDATDDEVHGKQVGRFFHSSTGTTTATASSRCTSSAATTCWSPTSARRTSTRPGTAGRSSSCWCGGCGRRGRTCRSRSGGTRGSAGGS
jgi:hypothetical protein